MQQSMHSFSDLSAAFARYFSVRHFPKDPAGLYDAAEHILEAGGKRLRPVLVLMGSELFGDIPADAWPVATAIELFHNFTLIHDDIMDKAPLRRGRPTVHMRFNEPSALLAGDVMLLQSYDYLNQATAQLVPALISLLNKTGREVCEGQQLDMEFERTGPVSSPAYLGMIERKTAVLLAAGLKMGAMTAGAAPAAQTALYEFGCKLGLAFQIQDDLLDAFGDPATFGKQPGGDILQNKKTFLLVHALETATPVIRRELTAMLSYSGDDKVEKVLQLYRDCGVDIAARNVQEQYTREAEGLLGELPVGDERKQPLLSLAATLLKRTI